MAATQRQFRPGDFLFKEGTPSAALFVIKSGTVAIRKRKGGGYVEIARVYANEVLGELAFFDRLPRSAAAVALSQVEVIEIDFDSLDKIYKQIPPYFQTIMMCVANRLRKASERLQKLQRNVVDEDNDVETQKEEEKLDATTLLAAIADEKPEKSEKKDAKD